MINSNVTLHRSGPSVSDKHGLRLLLSSLVIGFVFGCGGAERPTSTGGVGGGNAFGGASVVGGANGSGGSLVAKASGGSAAAVGGAPAGGFAASGGTSASSGGNATGGNSGAATGGNVPTGGRATGGAAAGGSPTGGKAASGGAATGGSSTSTGGASLGSGGTTTSKSGTTTASGGSPIGGASSNVGGSATTGGSQSPGGSTSAGGRITTGGASTGGNGGSSAYAPCPTNGSPCIILPFGDSITDGVSSTDLAGYRSPLFKLIVQANQNITFVGSRSSGPAQVSGKTFPKNHEGHPGWTIDTGYVSYGDGISTLIPSPAFNTIPHIVLLMIGTNDLNSSKGLDTMADRLDSLLGKIVAVAPSALIVVAAPTPITANPAPSALATYDTKIPGLVKARADKGQHIVAVDMSKMPTSNLSSDGIHPNDQGYTYMASIWYAAIKDLLPQ